MDTEDREHFRTIRSVSVAPSDGRQNKDYRSRPDLAYFQIRANAICGCYRRDEAQNPEAFAAALTAVLSDYPPEIADYAADPRTGIVTRYPMGLPNIGQIKEFCDAAQAKREWVSTYEQRVQRQIEEREKWKDQPVSERLKEKARAWLERTDPVALDMAGVTEADNSQEAAMARLEAAENEPIKPGYVSPSLLKTLNGNA